MDGTEAAAGGAAGGLAEDGLAVEPREDRLAAGDAAPGDGERLQLQQVDARRDLAGRVLAQAEHPPQPGRGDRHRRVQPQRDLRQLLRGDAQHARGQRLAPRPLPRLVAHQVLVERVGPLGQRAQRGRRVVGLEPGAVGRARGGGEAVEHRVGRRAVRGGDDTGLVLLDQRQHARVEVADVVGQVGVGPLQHRLVGVRAVQPERDLAQQEPAQRVGPEGLEQRARAARCCRSSCSSWRRPSATSRGRRPCAAAPRRRPSGRPASRRRGSAGCPCRPGAARCVPARCASSARPCAGRPNRSRAPRGSWSARRTRRRRRARDRRGRGSPSRPCPCCARSTGRAARRRRRRGPRCAASRAARTRAAARRARAAAPGSRTAGRTRTTPRPPRPDAPARGTSRRPAAPAV